MKFYAIDTVFTFGKYKGNTVRQILDVKPSYIDWCAINLDHFYITENDIAEIKTIKNDFSITLEGQQKLDEKYANWKSEQQDDNASDDRVKIDWSHYDGDLDMDQQSLDFWDQF